MVEQYSGNARVDDCLVTETRKPWTLLKNPNISTISIWGWDGIGKSVIANRIMGKAKNNQEANFDVVILISVPRHALLNSSESDIDQPVLKSTRRRALLPAPPLSHTRAISRPYLQIMDEARRGVRALLLGSFGLKTIIQLAKEQEMELQEQKRRAREERRRELQAKIMAELKLNVGQSAPAAITYHLANWLARRRFLIVFSDVWEHIDLKEIGVPLTTPGNGSKVIFIPMSEKIHKETGADVFLQQSFRSLSGDQAWRLLDAEARDAAAALSFYPNQITSDSILECFSYVSLFRHGTDASSLKEFWRSQGFFDEFGRQLRGTEEEEDIVELMEMTMNALLAQLSERCLLSLVRAEEIQMPPNGAWKLVSSRKRFLIQCDSSSQVPQSNQWEVAERISLSNNKIQELPTEQLAGPPNCPRLLTLLLNDNKSLKSISYDFFENMPRLQVLDLSATGIKYLPSSVSCLRYLRMLKLRNCRRLEDLPTLKDLLKLEVLDIGQTSLPAMKEASFEGMLGLRILDISNGAAKNLSQLSVKDCPCLSNVIGLEGLLKLATLDLSRTKIKWLPHEIFNLPGLKRLHLLGMKGLRIIEWDEIERFPEELVWRRQALEPPLQESPQGNSGRFFISATHDSIFHSLDQTCKLSQSYLQKFYFLICSCERGPKYRHTHFRRSRFPYSKVYAEHESSIRNKRLMKYDRWVEVCGGKTDLKGLRGVLSMTDFYCLRGNEFIKTVFDEGMQVGNLKECWIEKCDQLESVSTGNLRSKSFSCLQHLYLQCCPKLINIFSSSIQLKRLEFMEIKFCGRLENVHLDENVVGQDAFAELSELHLWELGKLKRICSGYLPKVKKLKIGGCSLLKQLPLNGDDASAVYVEIQGDAAWWKGIVWEGGIMPKNICFKDHCSF